MGSEALQFIEQHDISTAGIDIVAFADPEPQCCVVSFSSMNPGKYERFSWFEKRRLDIPGLYIFLKDEPQHYYRGTPQSPLKAERIALLENLLAKHGVSPARTVTVGSSMGGYAAIDFAVSMNLGGCISVNPQVDRQSALLHTVADWLPRMDESDWEDLDALIARSPKAMTEFLIIHGSYPADVEAGAKLRQSFTARDYRFSIEVHADPQHGWMGMNSRRLFNVINDFAQTGILVAAPAVA